LRYDARNVRRSVRPPLPHPNDRQKKDGALEAQADEVRQPYVLPRRRLFFAVWLTVVALPVLAIDNIPRTEARAAPIEAVSADAIDVATTATSSPSITAAAPLNPADLVPTSVRLRAPTSQPTTTTSPATTASKPQTPATAPPATAPPTTAARRSEQTGGASWYDYNPGECAHPTIPKGTVVTITSLATGASATCVVTDRGPHGAGRIIDLDRGTFSQLADPNAGVIEVRITW
jgi:rare lipoprotein A